MNILFKKQDSKGINYLVVSNKYYINIYKYKDVEQIKRYKYKIDDEFNNNTKWNFSKINNLIKDNNLSFDNKNAYSIAGTFKNKPKHYYWIIPDSLLGKLNIGDLVKVKINNKPPSIVKIVEIVPTMSLDIFPEKKVIKLYEKSE